MNKTLIYITSILIIIGILLMALGTTKYVYPREQFSGVNGMYEVTGNTTPNYFLNLLGLAIFLFGIGGLLSYFELNKKGINQKGEVNG
jgi:uncharacterized membrane protein